jgi:hypothetical protein
VKPRYPIRKMDTLGRRLRGMIGYRPAPGVWIFRLTPWVHTFGVRAPIDVFFCDRSGRVLRVTRALRPRRVSAWVWGARWTIETFHAFSPGWPVGQVLPVQAWWDGREDDRACAGNGCAERER